MFLSVGISICLFMCRALCQRSLRLAQRDHMAWQKSVRPMECEWNISISFEWIRLKRKQLEITTSDDRFIIGVIFQAEKQKKSPTTAFWIWMFAFCCLMRFSWIPALLVGQIKWKCQMSFMSLLTIAMGFLTISWDFIVSTLKEIGNGNNN